MYRQLAKTPLTFFTNLAVWLFCCMLAQIHRVIEVGRSPLTPLTSDDHDFLVGLVDQRLLWYVLLGCLFLVAVVAIIGHLAGTPNGFTRTQQMLSQVLAESASALLNFGSLLASVAFFAREPIYIIGAIPCWFVWLVFKPKERASSLPIAPL